MSEHYEVIVVGGGQAGLSMSHFLTQHKMSHVVLEKNTIAHSWKTQRWDSFCLVTPNWQCRLPEFPYTGPEPDGFMLRDEIVDYVEAFARQINAPVRDGVNVKRLSKSGGVGFHLETTAGSFTADQIVLAVSGYHAPNIPRIAERLNPSITQIHSSAYRNSAQLPEGGVMVVGSGQSGCQIAEDLHLAGRQVHLAVGSAPRCPRFYRGRDAVEWLDQLGQYDLPVDKHSLKEKVRKNANHYLTGRDGGRDIDLRKFGLEGMKLYGRLCDATATTMTFADDLSSNLDNADRVYNGICALIDDHIERNNIEAPLGEHYQPVWRPSDETDQINLNAEKITSVIWTTGFRSDWSWVELPVFDGSGYPVHTAALPPLKVYTYSACRGFILGGLGGSLGLGEMLNLL